MSEPSTDNSHIRLRGVSVHNLQNIDLDLPHHRLIAICGVSGSGKTSLALDTLYAEGQRRYIESFSAYTRQFLQQLQKPEARLIEGIPAAIAVTHKNPSRSNRATVGTETEVNDYLGLLFAHIGTVVCHGCGKEIRQDSPEAVAATLALLPTGVRWMLGFEEAVPEKQEIEHWLADLIEQGYVRAIVNDEVVNLEPALAAQLTPEASVTVILDRLVAGKVAEERLRESVESAMAAGNGSCVAVVADESGPIVADGWQRQKFSSSLRCEACDIEYPELQPQLFNFNRSLGACHECEGFGNVVLTDDDKVVPDRQKTLREGAIVPWNSPAYKHELEELLELAADYDLPVDVPYEQLTEDHLRLIQQGVPERKFGGLEGFFQWLERRKYKMHLRVFLSRWKRHEPCPECRGARLKKEVLAIRVGSKNFAEVLEMPINGAIEFFSTLSEPKALASGDVGLTSFANSPEASAFGSHHPIADRLLTDVLSRLRYLQDVGVNYLTLDRPLRTLSAGEAQRVALTATLGSNLVDMLYVLDEPSIGLHPANVESLATSIIRLRDRGNSVVVVEHEELLLERADHLVEVGPGAGQGGGKIVFQGTPAQALEDEKCVTGQWMAGRRGLGLAGNRRPHLHGKIQLQGARGRNLKNLSVDFPLGVLCVVTGVSGAGKSTLVDETLYPALMRIERLNDGSATVSRDAAPLEFDNLLGAGQIEEVVRINDAPIGRSPRSNPVTFIKAFDPIRKLFSEQSEAKAKGFGAGHFSFNVSGGRCDTCNGDGSLQIDLQFMADVYMPCQDCHGSRYRQDVLDVKYRGQDIAEVLNMTAREAFSFFRGQKKILMKLKCLLDVGLDYLRLGQSATTLSTGEAQRLKLAVYVGGKRKGRTLFLLDEPTTGLHFTDILKLLDCFDALLDVGHSLILVEHNLQLMKAADWLIDIGPGAADQGGQIVATGTPEEVAANTDSLTGRFLEKALANQNAFVS